MSMLSIRRLATPKITVLRQASTKATQPVAEPLAQKCVVNSQNEWDPLTRTVAVAEAFAKKCVVNSHNEWDPLEEIIVGKIEGSTIPEWHVSGKAVWPQRYWEMYKTKAGQPFPKELMEAAAKELDYLAHVLEGEGVTVRRPEFNPDDFKKPFETPDFKSISGLYAAMPRDVLIVVGNEIIEAPMAWRSRYFEFRPYRSLVKGYFEVSDRRKNYIYDSHHGGIYQYMHYVARCKMDGRSQAPNE
jgi:hypothetical protein